MIDLGQRKEMSLDETTGIAQVSPAVHGGDELNPYLKAYGRFFPSGGCSTVGLGGFPLQGGMGWNHRGWGYAAEQVAAIDVVTADGELVRADEDQNSDLFWAARGAGPGFFRVVTRFHLRTRALPAGLSMTMHVLLNFYVPGDLDLWVTTMATPATSPTLPPPSTLHPATAEQEAMFDRRLHDLATQRMADQADLLMPHRASASDPGQMP